MLQLPTLPQCPPPLLSMAGFRTRTDFRPGDSVPIMLDGQAASSIPVADLIP
jgi:hypothetical protein